MDRPVIPEDKFIIGLTGNIATGKSAVMQLAAQRGAFTLDADQVVHEILNNDADLQQAIATAFGSTVRRADGRIDRPDRATTFPASSAGRQDRRPRLGHHSQRQASHHPRG